MGGFVTGLADRFEGATGVDATGAIEDSDGPVEAIARYNVGGLAFGESVVSDLTGSSEAEVRDDYVARGGLRDVIDAAYSYDGEWGGEEDSIDLAGPAAWGTEGSVGDAAVDREGEERSPEEAKTKLLIWAGLAGVGLYLLAPVLELVAAGVDDG